MKWRSGKGTVGAPEGDVEAALRYAFGKEQASALGRAGRRLELALQAYRRCQIDGEQASVAFEAVRQRVADELWSLVVQREVAGLGADNLTWLQREYQVPDEVVRHLGRMRSAPTLVR